MSQVKWALGVIVALAAIITDWFAGGLMPRLVFGTGTVQVETIPAGAAVFINGRKVGNSPLTFEGVRPGAVVVKVEHRFHPTAVHQLSLARGATERIDVQLESAYGDLEIVSNPQGADIWLNGDLLESKTPIRLDDIPTGRHEMTAFIYGRERKTEFIDVTPGASVSYAFELGRVPMGSLTVDTVPNDASVAFTDLDQEYVGEMLLPIGSYEVTITRGGFGQQIHMLRVDQKANVHTVVLDRLFGELTVNVRPANAKVWVAYRAGEDEVSRRYDGSLPIPTGALSIRATAMGYRNYARSLRMTPDGLNHTIAMQTFDIAPGRVFRDPLESGGEGPPLVIVAQGTFVMGSQDGAADERPAHAVSITQPFAMSIYEITQGDMRAYQNFGVGADRMPVTDIGMGDVTAYLRWLSAQTGATYRLPSEAEWEYAARAGTTTAFYFGDDASGLCEWENVADQSMKKRFRLYEVADCDDGAVRITEVGGFKPNPFGLYDMLGNVQEWVADCWHGNYSGAPDTAQAWGTHCTSHVVRGGGWDRAPNETRVSFRSLSSAPNSSRGFRVVREL